MSLFQGLSEFIDPCCLPATDKTAPKNAPKIFLKIFQYSIDYNIVSAIIKIRKAKEDKAMTKAEIKNKFEEIASKKVFLEMYEEEAEEIFDEWNNLIPEAEKSGMTHSEISEIWETTKWGSFRG